MKILFLGASSFTGFHFVKKISTDKNFKIYCTLTKNFQNYYGLKKSRIEILKEKKNIYFLKKTLFGNNNFLKIIKQLNFDVICLHHANTKFYNDDNKFNKDKSIKTNTKNIDKIFKLLNKNTKIIISNTIYQKNKTKKNSSITKYGKSKEETYEIYKIFCNKYKLKYKSIFIPNPWGILEEKRMLFSMFDCWLNQKTFIVRFPRYVRDNIYVDKLKNIYFRVLKSQSKKKEYFPSGYCCSNKKFILAIKKKFEKFFQIKCSVKFLNYSNYSLPISRINSRKKKDRIIIKENLNKYFLYYKKVFKI